MESLILTAEQAIACDETLLGGKAARLAWLSRNGLPVPVWLVLTTRAFDLQLSQQRLDQWIRQQLQNRPGSQADWAAISQQICSRIQQQELHPKLARELIAALPCDLENDFFAVRSSAVGEDSATASFAGQMDSLLFQRGFEQISQSVLNCMASAFSERAIRYRITHGMDIVSTRTAVIVQRMIDGEVSGVFFTAHPISGERNRGLISACYGAGEGIVSGVCTTDEFTVGLYDDTIESSINDKDIKMVFDSEAGHGLGEVEVPTGQRQQPCLRPEQILELRDYGVKISEQLRAPQDIEWTFQDDRFYILQTRPVTSLPEPAKSKGERVVWDNSNIQESYCGVTTPLTFSFARRAYATVYEQTLRLFKPPQWQLDELQPVFNNLLGLIKGRVYYNINNWYRGLLLLPSFKTNKADMERMMGLQDPVDFVEDRVDNFWQKVQKTPRLLKGLVQLLLKFRQMDQLVAGFRGHFENCYREFDRRRLHTLEMAELMALAAKLDRQLLRQWNTPIINDFYVMIMNGRVHRWLHELEYENPALLQNNLMAGEEGIESTEPTKFLLRLCEAIRADQDLKSLVEQTDNAALLETLQHHAPEVHRQCLDYIERYGDRCMGELKLESVTLRQDPSFMFAVLKNFLGRDDISLKMLDEKEQSLRQQAEQEAFALITQYYGARKLGRFKRDLTKLRAAVKNRENMRLARTRLFGMYRDIYQEIGNQLAFYGVLNNARDIYYLTVEELEAYVDGRSVQSDLKPLVASRQAEFAVYENEDLAHHFITHGPVYHHNDFVYPYAADDLDQNAEQLSGLGCYPGIVEENIKLIFSPNDELNLNGQILCTVRTDPGWAPLFPTAGGLLVERGSTLSHSAVVARELGIPAIVNIPGLTKILQNGERVRMDGAKGTVTRIKGYSQHDSARESQ